jgi:hypothetical protein
VADSVGSLHDYSSSTGSTPDTIEVMKRTLLVLVVVGLAAQAFVAPSATAGSPPYRPDAWIKLCGQSTGCTINPPPHPWKGNNVYNSNAKGQTIFQRIDNGEGVWYWLTFQNDGTTKDTFDLSGCTGNKNFKILRVLIGKYKVPVGVSAVHITRQFIHSNYKFTLKPGGHVAITLNMVTVNPNLHYRCPVSITSEGDSGKSDTVAVKIKTF